MAQLTDRAPFVQGGTTMHLRDRIKRFALRFLPERLLQNLKKIHYARRLRQTDPVADPDLLVLRHLVAPGHRVIDVGANVGLYTKFMAGLVGPWGKVYSIEPVPQTYEILSSNVEKLGLINVEAFNVAASSEDGFVQMQVPHYATGGENYYEARIVAEPAGGELRTVQVHARTLDSLFGPEDRIAFVKCDVEGHERSCLAGAAELLQTARPAWLIEISSNPDQRDSAAAEVFALLAGYGYEPYWFDGRHLNRRRPGDRSVNYFFLTAVHLARLPAGLVQPSHPTRRAA
jgi:FkbM family methyltransferase